MGSLTPNRQLTGDSFSSYSAPFWSFLETIPSYTSSEEHIKAVRLAPNNPLPYGFQKDTATLVTLAGKNYEKDKPLLEIHGNFFMSSEVDLSSQESQSLFDCDVKDHKGIRKTICVQATPGDAHRMKRSCRPNCVLKLCVGNQIGLIVYTRKELKGNVELTIPFNKFSNESTSPLECAKHANPEDCQMEIDRQEHQARLKKSANPERQVEESQSTSRREVVKRGKGSFQHTETAFPPSASPSTNDQRSSQPPPPSHDHGKRRPDQPLYNATPRVNEDRKHYEDKVPPCDDSRTRRNSFRSSDSSRLNQKKTRNSDHRRSNPNHVDRNPGHSRSRIHSRNGSPSVGRISRKEKSSRTSSHRNKKHGTGRSNRESEPCSKSFRKTRSRSRGRSEQTSPSPQRYPYEDSPLRVVRESGAKDSAQTTRPGNDVESSEIARNLSGTSTVCSLSSERSVPLNSQAPPGTADQPIRTTDIEPTVDSSNHYSPAFQKYLPILQSNQEYKREVGPIKNSVKGITGQSMGREVTKDFREGKVVMKIKGFFAMSQEAESKGATFVIEAADGQLICLQTQDDDSLKIRRSCKPTCTLSLAVGSEIALLVIAKKELQKRQEILLPFNADWKDSKVPLVCAKHQNTQKQCRFEKDRKTVQNMNIAKETSHAKLEDSGSLPQSSHSPINLAGSSSSLPSASDHEHRNLANERTNVIPTPAEMPESVPSSSVPMEASDAPEGEPEVEGEDEYEIEDENPVLIATEEVEPKVDGEDGQPVVAAEELQGDVVDRTPRDQHVEQDHQVAAGDEDQEEVLFMGVFPPEVQIVAVKSRVDQREIGNSTSRARNPVQGDRLHDVDQDVIIVEDPIEVAVQVQDEQAVREEQLPPTSGDGVQTPAIKEAKDSSGGGDVQGSQGPKEVQGTTRNGVNNEESFVVAEEAVEEKHRALAVVDPNEAQDLDPGHQLRAAPGAETQEQSQTPEIEKTAGSSSSGGENGHGFQYQDSEKVREEALGEIHKEVREDDPVSVADGTDVATSEDPSTSSSSSRPSESENSRKRSQIPTEEDSESKKTKKDIPSSDSQPTVII